MIRNKYWCKVPSESVLGALPQMLWRRTRQRTAASETAALMVYVALILMSEVDEWPLPQVAQIADATYDALQKATGLSRALVAAGVVRLVELDLIRPQGSHQQRRYLIVWKGTTRGWFKLPSMAIVRHQVILPFANFTLRSKHELHAMKLYLYLAARRPNGEEFTLASYENINDRIGVPERDVRKAISLLIGTGLLRNVNRERDVALKNYGPNQYYLTGSDRLKGYDADRVASSLPINGATPSRPVSEFL